MREIKFRAWNKALKTMLDVEAIDFRPSEPQILADNFFYPLSDCEIMQHTGLTIKHRKKPRQDVFEGDILKGKYYFRGVGWYDTGEGDYSVYGPVEYKDGKFVCCGFDLGDLVYEDRIKIIGNIYENPELLGG